MYADAWGALEGAPAGYVTMLKPLTTTCAEAALARVRPRRRTFIIFFARKEAGGSTYEENTRRDAGVVLKRKTTTGHCLSWSERASEGVQVLGSFELGESVEWERRSGLRWQHCLAVERLWVRKA